MTTPKYNPDEHVPTTKYDWRRLSPPWRVYGSPNRNGTRTQVVIKDHPYSSPATYRIQSGRITVLGCSPEGIRTALDELEAQLKQCEVRPHEEDPLLRSVPLDELVRIVDARKAEYYLGVTPLRVGERVSTSMGPGTLKQCLVDTCHVQLIGEDAIRQFPRCSVHPLRPLK